MIPAQFYPEFFDHLYFDVKYFGIQRTLEHLVLKGEHPSFAAAAIKKVIREKGW